MTALLNSSGFAEDFDGARFIMIEVRVGDLKIDPRYQRDVRKAHLRYMVANFDWYLLDPLAVSRRADGSMFVMDGQHRLMALRELGYDNQIVNCMVFDGLTLEQEARRFNTQDTRKPLSALERFRARLLEGQSAELAVAEVLRATGFFIDYNAGGERRPASVSCVAALLQVYRSGGAAHLRQVLSTISAGFGHDCKPDSMMVGGLSRFVTRYEGEFDEARLVDVMRRVTPEQMARETRGIQQALRANAKTAYALTLVNHYNKKLVNKRLSEFSAKSGGR